MHAPSNSAKHSSSSRDKPLRKFTTACLRCGSEVRRSAPAIEEREATAANLSSKLQTVTANFSIPKLSSESNTATQFL